MLDDKSKTDELTELVIPAAKRAEIYKFIETKNKKWAEVVGERGLKLSGGEK